MTSADDGRPSRSRSADAQDDLRERLGVVLARRGEIITADTIALFPYAGAETLDAEYCTRLGRTLVRLLGVAIRGGDLEAGDGSAAALRTLALERSLTPGQLFAFAYLTERTALDELALDPGLGAASEVWPVVAQVIRRGSFDLLAAFTAVTQAAPSEAAITDPLTTLHTRPVFDAVLAREVERAGRFGHPIALMLFDVDRLSAINDAHGHGVGDRILERIGILLRKFFRQHDWLARYSDDGVTVLLTGPDAEHAADLAERARRTIAERLVFTDHRSGAALAVTVTAAVVFVRGGTDTSVDPERLLIEAEAALDRAKQRGRNRVEVGAGSSISRGPRRSSPSA